MDEILKRRVKKILPNEADLKQLLNEKKIRVYLGIDPTAKRLHLGHTIPLRKLVEFSEAGHEAILLFGTGTVLVGDPSERDTGRKLITENEIQTNIETWKEQVSPLVNFSKIKIMENSDWLTKLTLKEIVGIASNISAVQLFKRNSFRKRLERGDTVWYHETMYPLFQGYDSVVMDIDLEIGGSDQEFNMLIGRELQKKINNREKFVLTTPMIMGINGKKMSKTSDNCVWLNDKPDDIFGKIMRIPDNQIIPYLKLATNSPNELVNEIENKLKEGTLNQIDAKKKLAEIIICELYKKESADNARVCFENTFQKGLIDYNKKWNYKNGSILTDIVADFSDSRSQAKRKILQGGVSVNNEVVKDSTVKININDQIKIGSKTFVKIV